MIEVKYGSEWWGRGEGACTNPFFDPYGVSLWRTIRQELLDKVGLLCQATLSI